MKGNFSSPIRGSLRRFPKPEKPFLDRLIDRVKKDVQTTPDPLWWKAAVTAYGQLQQHRRKVRAA